MEKRDRYMEFKGKKHLEDKEYIRIEDIFGFILSFKSELTDSDIKSLRNYNNQLRKNVCGNCTRDRNDVRNCEGCRALKLKHRMKEVIRSAKWFIYSF